MTFYYIVHEYDNPKAVFENRKEAEKFIDDRPGRKIETVVSMKTAAKAVKTERQAHTR